MQAERQEFRFDVPGALRTELVKLRVLPTPRVLLMILLGLGLVVAIINVFVAPSNVNSYTDGALGASTTATSVSAIVFGVWVVGVEYGQSTMRRVVATTPDRNVILLWKLVLMLVLVIVGTVLIGLIDWSLSWVAGQLNGKTIPSQDIPGELGAAVVNNFGYAVLGFAIVLLTRSMAGGITTTLVIAIVVDSAIGAIPTVGDYTFGSALGDVVGTIRGDKHAEMWGRGLAVSTLWLALVGAAAWWRFTQQDVK